MVCFGSANACSKVSDLVRRFSAAVQAAELHGNYAIDRAPGCFVRCRSRVQQSTAEPQERAPFQAAESADFHEQQSIRARRLILAGALSQLNSY